MNRSYLSKMLIFWEAAAKKIERNSMEDAIIIACFERTEEEPANQNCLWFLHQMDAKIFSLFACSYFCLPLLLLKMSNLLCYSLISTFVGSWLFISLSHTHHNTHTCTHTHFLYMLLFYLFTECPFRRLQTWKRRVLG